jgi:V/A-type H+-transporting ATPase subunit E
VSTKPLDLETKLIERIVKQRNERVAKAEERAKEIIKSAEEDVERIKEESQKQILSLIGSELRAVSDRIVGGAELEGRKMIMLSRQELLSKVFDDARDKLVEIAGGIDEGTNYSDILVKLIIEAATAIGGEEFIVSANEQDLIYLKKNLKKVNKLVSDALGGGDLKLDDEPIDVLGGVVMRNTDDSKTFHNTLEGRLVNVRRRIEAQVGKILGVI